MRKLCIIFLLIPVFLNGQITDNFEDGDISEWTESAASRWDASTDSPINGTYSLHHIYDNASNGNDRISLNTSGLNVDLGEITWQFQVKHGFDPSSSNNWAVFLMADADATEMYSGGSINGYAIGVNLTGTDDTLCIWKASNGAFSIILKTSVNWQIDIGTAISPGIEVIRSITGNWSVKIDSDGGFDNLVAIGDVTDNEFTGSNYFGVYYEYSPAQDQKLWFDDLSIYPQVDDDAEVEDPIAQIPADDISSLIDSVAESKEVFKFQITDGGATDGLSTNVKKVRIKDANPVNGADWTDHINGIILKENTDIICPDSVLINDAYIDIYLAEDSLVINDGTSKEISLYVFLNKSNIIDSKVFQFLIDADDHGWETYYGTEFNSNFTADVNSNDFTIEVEATNMQLGEIPGLIIKDSTFTVEVSVTDINGNLDIEFLEDLTIAETFGNGELISSSSLIKAFSNGTVTWDDLSYNTNVEFGMSFTNATFGTQETDTIVTIDSVFLEDFESGGFSGWENTSDWLVTNEDSINGNFSLKHNKTGVTDTSYIFHEIPDVDIETGSMIWRFNMKNGNFDPSSNNYFAYYLMADESINADSVNAYAVGVNLTGSDDLLSLWYVKDGIVDETIIQSGFNWDENELVGVEVVREANGNWIMKYDSTGNFDDLVGSTEGIHNETTDFNYTGLKYRFTSSNGGLFWLDDITIGLKNSPPGIKFINIVSQTEIEVVFTEKITEASAQNVSNYSIIPDSTGSISILSATLLANEKTVELSTGNLVTDNYKLNISSIADLEGLVNNEDSVSFQYFLPGEYGDVVITEIMADPSPKVGLPEYEFFELFNNTSYDISLEDWKYVVGNDTNTFSASKVKPNDYLIITSTTGADSLSDFGDTYIGIGTTDLSNAGKNLKILNKSEEIIYNVTYADSWYNDSEKEDGGWSLEIINPDNFCSTFSNWSASTAEIGGTPGSINSIDGDYIDNIAPNIDSYSIYADSIQLVFSEMFDTNSVQLLSNFTIDNGIGNPIDVTIYDDLKTIDLIFPNSLQDETSYEFVIQNIDDECENSEEITIEFTYYIAKPGDIVITEVMADPSPVVGLPDFEYFELFNNSNYDISLGEWKYIVGNDTNDFSSIDLLQNSYLIVCSSSGADTLDYYGNTFVGISNDELSNAGKYIEIISNHNEKINSVFYSDDWYNDEEKEDGGWSLEIINPDNLCSTSTNWRASEAEIGGTPGSINSIDGDYTDTVAPSLLLYEVFEDSIQLSFSEPLDTNSILVLSNYAIDSGIGNPMKAEFNEEWNLVYLKFSSAFTDETNYTLNIENLMDECENEIEAIEINFDYYIPKQNDIVITEIMADPTPVVGLPDKEYVEIFNITDYDISLHNWQITVGDKSRDIEHVILNSNEYLIITSSSGADTLSYYGNTYVGIGSSDLTNSGNTLKLMDNNENIVNEVSYSETWYGDEEKEDGGYSLEIQNPENFCSTNSNWTASNSSLGGTPGSINSVDNNFQDTFAPELLDYYVLSKNSIVLQYNEMLDSASVFNTANYIINNNIGNPSSINLNEEQKIIELEFISEFVDETSYQLTIQNIEDECGNFNEPQIINFTYYLAKTFDIVINEIMADPEPQVGLPASDFVELYNKTNYEINLSNWQLIIADKEMELLNVSIDPESFLLIVPTGNEDEFTSYGYVLGLISSSDLTNNGKSIILQNTQQVNIDSISYNKDWYHDDDKVNGGWSIERIDPENTCSSIDNWKASEDADGGTPGNINSVFGTFIDTQKPLIEYIKVINQSVIQLVVSEFVDVNSASDKLKYIVDNSIGNPAFIEITGTTSSIINLTFGNSFTNGSDYTLYVSGLKDACGNAMNDTSFIFSYYYVNEDDIVFNEIMIDPSPSIGLPEYEYIELYNRTDKIIDVSDWQLVVNGSNKAIPNFAFSPNEYIILCSQEADSVFSEFTNSIGLASFPSLPNSEAEISIIDTAERVIASIRYFDLWYNNTEKDDGGYSIEKIDYENLCSGISNWKASDDLTGGTPGIQNSVYAENIDNSKPNVEDVFVLSDTVIQILFSENIDRVSAENITNYNLNNTVSPDNIVFDSINQNQVILQFVSINLSDSEQTLNIINITDECMNMMESYSTLVSYNQPNYNEVVINEIMFDPEPAFELPEAEYIELYNASNQPISFVNTIIHIGTSDAELPNFNIASGEYLLITDSETEDLLTAYGKVIAVENLPALSNSSALIKISNSEGVIYSVVEYSDEWISDPFKEDGGWSLELIDPSNPLGIAVNWAVCDNEIGGTPGEINSVFGENLDNTNPEFIRVAVENDSILKLIFTESIDTLNLNSNLFSADHDYGNPVKVDPIEPLYSQILLHYNNPFDFGSLYEITVSDQIQDLSGNGLSGNLSQFFALPTNVEINSILINEVLFNPMDDGVDYIELYNNTLHTYDLNHMYLATKDVETNEFKSVELIDPDGYLFFPESYLVLTSNPTVVKEQYTVENEYQFVEMGKFPSLPNDEGIIAVTDTIGNIIDEIHYSEDQHFQLLNSPDGVALERLNFNWPSKDASNWHSAAEFVGFGTPTYKNSQFTESVETSGQIAFQDDVFSPDNDGFNDQLMIDYKFTQPGNTVNCYVFNAKGYEVRHLLNNEILATEGTVSWDGLDNTQNKVPIGIYIIYFEIFNANGDVSQIKKTCVVASKL